MGTDLCLHWSWFLVTAYQLTSRDGEYTSVIWNMVEYLTPVRDRDAAEFGHALACGEVGGQADLSVLRTLGGVACVNPPRRPGARLWSSAAGPLVKGVPVPVRAGLLTLAKAGRVSPEVVACWRAALAVRRVADSAAQALNARRAGAPLTQAR